MYRGPIRFTFRGLVHIVTSVLSHLLLLSDVHWGSCDYRCHHGSCVFNIVALGTASGQIILARLFYSMSHYSLLFSLRHAASSPLYLFLIVWPSVDRIYCVCVCHLSPCSLLALPCGVAYVVAYGVACNMALAANGCVAVRGGWWFLPGMSIICRVSS